MQHDCVQAQCQAEVASTSVIQEHQTVARSIPVVQHRDDTSYIINTHALHNAHLLRRVLPRVLIAPSHTHVDRTRFHAGLAPQAHTTQAKKREGAAQKRAATAAAARSVTEPVDQPDTSAMAAGSDSMAPTS